MRFYCQEQLSGIETIDFYLLHETTGWPIVLSDRSATHVVFSSDPNNVEATVKQNSFKNNTKTKDGIHEIDLSYTILTRSEALEQLLDQYAAAPGVAVVKYYNNFTKIFGTNEEPLFMNFENNDGTSVDSESGVNISITGLTRNRPVYFTK